MTKRQPIADRIDDLCQWLRTPAPLRADASGALRILGEIAASHAALEAACEELMAWAGMIRSVRDAGGPDTAVDLARAALAKARGT